MENCLVTNLKSIVDNANLHHFNKLYLKASNTGTGESKVRLYAAALAEGQSHYYSEGVNVHYKVISGNAEFYQSSIQTRSLGTDTTQNGPVIVQLPTAGEAIISIENFDEVCDRISKETFASNSTKFSADLNEAARKNLVILQLDSVYNNNNIELLKNCSNLSSLRIPAAAIGRLSSLTSLNHLEIITLGYYNNRCTKDFVYSLKDLEDMAALTTVSIQGGLFKGGDIYSLLNSKSKVNIELDRTNSITYAETGISPAVTCNYISGTSEVPTFMLTKANFLCGEMTLDNLKNAFRLFIDGINSNKITLSGTPSISLKKSSSYDLDTEANTLKTTLEGLGVTISLSNSNV